MKIKHKIAFIGLVLIGCLFLNACQNTAEGFGKDMEASGKAIQKNVTDDKNTK